MVSMKSPYTLLVHIHVQDKIVMVLPWERFQILIVCVVVACSFHFLPLLCHYVLLLQIHDNQTNVETGSNLSIHLEPNPKWHVFAICLQVFSGFLRPEKRAVNGISLAIPNGECFGLLGVNGWWNLYQSSVSWKHMTSALCTCIVWSMWLREHADEQTTIIIMWLDSINIMNWYLHNYDCENEVAFGTVQYYITS